MRIVGDFRETALYEKLHADSGIRSDFLFDVRSGKISAHIFGTLVDEGVAFDSDELAEAEQYLDSSREELRFNAMALLQPRYLDNERVRAHAQRLTRDPEEQIRERAFRSSIENRAKCEAQLDRAKFTQH